MFWIGFDIDVDSQRLEEVAIFLPKLISNIGVISVEQFLSSYS